MTLHPPSDSRLAAQLAFVVELDKLKLVLRQTLLVDGSRRENDAEHSWHVAAMAVLLAEYAPADADPLRASRMLLFHDVVEIDAGDTFIHDEAGQGDKDVREQAAATRIYGLLPEDQAADLAALWREYEDRQTADSRFAARHAQEGIPDGASGQSGFVEQCFDASRTSCREATESHCDVA